MKTARRNPLLFEASARLWLRRLSADEERPLSLSSVPDRYLRAISDRFDLLWLMGVWRRSPAAKEQALATRGIVEACDAALPGWKSADVEGSPYAVPGYELDPALGAPEELGRFRERLNALGVGLVLDFVPNHLAMDHPWTLQHPDWFVGGTDALAAAHPDLFFRTAHGAWLAHGRDPNFPPWTDTVQVDFFSSGLREGFTRELLSIARVADGIRCDMAMLGLSDVFEGVWGWAATHGARPPREFWAEVIERVRTDHPQFLFVAEAYWDLEPRLLELGFDYVYDKRLYDLLLSSNARAIRGHLQAQSAGIHRQVRFVENHDEQRAAVAFGRDRSRSAATAALTLPGLRLIHDGQTEGRRVHVPVQLVRQPDERPDGDLVAFYDRLLSLCSEPLLQSGDWRLLDVEPASNGNESHRDLLAWSWSLNGDWAIVVINHSGAPAHGRVCLPPGAAGARAPRWTDRLDAFSEAGTVPELHLVLRMEPWSARVLAPALRGRSSD
jgi:hypothetical protein